MCPTTTKPVDLTHHFSKISKARRPNALKEYYKYLFTPGMCNFSGGLPHTSIFPFGKLDLSVDRPTKFPTTKEDIGGQNVIPDSDILCYIPRYSGKSVAQKIDLATALQYGSAQGYPPLHSVLRRLVSIQHPSIPYEGGPEVIIDGGSADGLSKVFDLLFNTWDKDLDDIRNREGLLVEEFVYGPPVAHARTKDVNIVPLKMDDEGMLAHGTGSLSDILQSWDHMNGKRPHVLYTIPTGQNPSSGTLSASRRKEVYDVCSMYDVVVVEDDPYWSLYYPSARSYAAQYRAATNNILTGPPTEPSTGYRFLDEMEPSFLNFDRDGRVIRLDSFSKTIAPGCRLGWITASPRVCEQLFRITDDTTQQPSGFVQAIVAQLIGEQCDLGQGPSSWGFDGWVRWLEGLRAAYERRMVKMATVFEQNRFFTTGADKVMMFDFQWPTGGMFIWVEVKVASHPLASTIDHRRLMRALWIHCTQPPYLILTVLGKDFAATEEIAARRGYLFFRFCFAAIDGDLLEAKSKSFTDACRDFWSINSHEKIDQLMREEDGQNPSG
ncbi:aromatic amino acid aminotransferase [Colletotrichum orchidophilum]|uniref:Aromatic amino acid aminotransferase n=1 Tax=Colletotrichum orchidophilum TaxID=1209926 RepID=A0A1G4B4Y0_9PEZI|nr:aromatic amino acid aminotransferase [Colletotrichum orchidophilum]OHE96500.1 aromatic amino acid aminotransferase [Colletotrichum orchidophilum]